MLKKILIPVLALGLGSVFAGEKAVKAKKVDLAAGKKVFDAYCLICHGATGKGDGAAGKALKPNPRNFQDTAYMSKRSRDTLRLVISEGGKQAGLSPLMASWKKVLKDDQIDNVLAYVLHFSQDSAKAVTILPPAKEKEAGKDK